MKEYEITLMIGSNILMLNEIKKVVEMRPLSGSYNKGDRRGGKPAKMTWFSILSWKSISMIPDKRADRILNKLWKMADRGMTSPKYNVLLDIAVYSDQEATSFVIPVDVINWAAKYNMDIEISTYICNMK